MKDIRLTRVGDMIHDPETGDPKAAVCAGDLYIDPQTGDIEITDSVEQAIRIRLLWFFGEWRLGPQFGIPYYEDILIKNPNQLRIRQLFRRAILSVEEVERVEDLQATIDPATRVLTVEYKAVAGGETHQGEVKLHVGED